VRYVQRKDGEGFEVPLRRPYRLACCDCGLVHDVVWVYARGKLAMAAKRNARATAARRRKNRRGVLCTRGRQPKLLRLKSGKKRKSEPGAGE
jgi:hypothetical protein